MKTCPSCATPIRSIFRYGRVLNKSLLDLTERKFISASQRRLAELEQSVTALTATVAGLAAINVEELKKGFGRFLSISGALRKEVTKTLNASRSPLVGVWEASHVSLQRLGTLRSGLSGLPNLT